MTLSLSGEDECQGEPGDWSGQVSSALIAWSCGFVEWLRVRVMIMEVVSGTEVVE